jgi:glycerol-3-phosphate dehydrogenase
MKRDIARLASEEYDILIIGAGIYGACAAWDAALRGLKVALIDRGDFGGATSQNSQKIIHGGLRYLQQADAVRVRESVRERRILTKIAPHFVHPFLCVMPTYGHFTRGREALAVALFINDLISFDRNRINDPQKRIPRGRTVSRKKILELLPGIPTRGLTGGAMWYDCKAHNTERLLLSFILSAAEKGARAANYIEVVGFIAEGRRVLGVKVLDCLSGKRFDIRARLVLNTTGPWTDTILRLLDPAAAVPPLRLSTALIIVTRPFIKGCGAGLPLRAREAAAGKAGVKGSRLYFVTPWRDVCLVGTVHLPYAAGPDDYRVTEGEIEAFIQAINAAYPSARLTRNDIRSFYGGLLTLGHVDRRTGEAVPLNQYRLIDHRRRHGWDGIVTVVGVKYTTARDVAVKAVDLAMKKLGLTRRKSLSHATPVYGGEIGRFDEFLAGAIRSKPEWVSETTMSHLVHHYGSRYADVLAHAERDRALAKPLPCQESVIGAEVVHAVREEMASKLADVIFRRTELGSAGCPGDECLHACADLMGAELGWDGSKKQAEIDSVKALYVPNA